MEELTLGFLVVSFVAGFLTVLAPCILPLLPVIIGSSTTGEKDFKKPLTIVASLSVSIVVFTLLLRASTIFIDIPDDFWKWLSGGILLIFGIVSVFPSLWENLSAKLNLNAKSNKLLGKGVQKGGTTGDIIIGAALGPVFTSCSITYAAIVAVSLPASFGVGLVYLLLYVVGLAIPLLMLAVFGQKLADKLAVLSDPHGKFKKFIGIIFIIIGIMIITGVDKEIEAWLIDQGLYDWQVELEENIGG